jgi:hypothetical protein
MNIQHLIEAIDEIAERLYPETPELAKLCQAVIIWERDNMSVTTPHYKDSYLRLLKGVEKRWQARLNQKKEEN